MQMHVNRANAKWVEAHSWTEPHIYDPAALVVGRADIKIYKHLLLEMLSEGKVLSANLHIPCLIFICQVALQLIDSDVRAEALHESSDLNLQPVLSFDPWEKIVSHFPWKVEKSTALQTMTFFEFSTDFFCAQAPDRGRLQGLSILSRRLLQIIVDVQNLGGTTAVGRLKVVLCVDSGQDSYVKELLIQRDFFGLSRENVLIITIPRFQGMHYDKVHVLSIRRT